MAKGAIYILQAWIQFHGLWRSVSFSLSSNPLQPSTAITPSKREKGNMRFVELNWVLFFWIYVLLVQHLCELRETNTTFLLLSAQIYCWFFCLICYIFANVVRSFEYRIQILIFTKPSIFEIVLSCFFICFLFWEKIDIKLEQNYIFNSIFNRGELQNSN